MQISQLVLGPIQTNVYFFLDEDTKEGFVVDPGFPSDQIAEVVGQMGMTLKYILLTHGHYDHILGVPSVKKQFPDAEIIISVGDERCLSDPNWSLCAKHGIRQETVAADRVVKEGDRLSIGHTELRVLETPGHTPGSICYLLEDEGILIAGDTVFQDSYGRTDLKGGSPQQMAESLYKIGRLEGNYHILPGHGPLTTLDHERQVDPYMTRKV